jgi:hypothetical protein
MMPAEGFTVEEFKGVIDAKLPHRNSLLGAVPMFVYGAFWSMF